MSAVIGSLRADLSASVAQFQSDMGACADAVKKFSREAKKVAAEIKEIGEAMSIALTLPLVLLGTEAVKQSEKAASAFASLQAAIASTGNASGKTARQLADASKELRNMSTFEDADILKNLTTNLLRFGNIQGPVFDRAQKSIVELSAALGTDLQSATIKVGRALNDPIQGVTALSRIGVQFTSQQKAQIKAMVQAGDGFKAQGMILDELEQKYGGAAEALRAASPTASLKNAWEDFTQTIGDKLVPALKGLADALAGLLDRFNQLSPGPQKTIIMVAAVAAAIGPLLTVLGSTIKFFATLAPLVFEFAGWLAGLAGAAADAVLALAGLAAPFLLVAAAVAAVIALVWPFRDEIVGALEEVWDKAKTLLGPAWGRLVDSLAVAFQTFGDALAALWAGPVGDFFRMVGKALADFAAFWIRVFGGVLVDALTALIEVIQLDVVLITGGLKMIMDVLRGDWSKAWKDAVDTASKSMAIITGKARGAGPKFPKAPPAPAAPAVSTAPLAAARKPPATNFNLDNQGEIDKQKAAAKEFANSLESMNRRISQGLGGLTLPKATAAAQGLNEQIDAFVKKAADAGVKTAAFDNRIKALRTRIEELKQTGLSKEAQQFEEAVNADAVAVDKLAHGGLPPLQEKLQAVDDSFEQLRKKIEDEIAQNQVLADSNDEAAAAMVRLKSQLSALGDAHVKATEAATRQYDAEVLLSKLQTQRGNLDTQQSIEDMHQARGEGGPIGSAQAKMQATSRDLERQRLDAQIKLQQLEAERDDAQARGDQAQVDNLNSEIALQQELYGLVSDTTAEQLTAAQRINDAFNSFTDDLSSSLTDILSSWNGDLSSLGNVFRKMISDIFFKPGADAISGAVGGVLKSALGGASDWLGSKFAGMFADGGTLNAGEWGIAGENGPEPIRAGPGGLTVYPNTGGAVAATGGTADGGARKVAVHVAIDASPELDARITKTSVDAAQQVVTTFSKNVLPSRVKTINKQPRRV